jgi:translation initiation factor 1
MPTNLCVCENLNQGDQHILVKVDKRRWGKPMTVMVFSNFKSLNVRKLLKKAKEYCASGGTVREDTIEIQGDHRQKLKKFLIREGYSEDQIEVR